MMKAYLAVTLVLLALLGLACAPKATPPQEAPSPAPVAPAPEAKAAPAASPQEAAWQKVVEAAKKEGTVTLYSYNFTSDTGIAMARAFQERYGIKVDIITGRGAEFTERLRTEARTGNRVGDWTEGSPVHLVGMKKAGLTAPTLGIPALQEKAAYKMEPLFLDPEGHVLIAYPMFMWPWINTKLVKPAEEPRSWFDLLQPRWKGKIIFNDPVVSSSAYLIFQPLLKAKVLTEDYLRKLGEQDLIFTPGAPMSFDRLARGEGELFLGTQEGLGADYITRGAPLKLVDLKEGMAGQAIVMAAIKDAPHPKAAQVFTHWWLSQEGQAIYSKVKPAPTVRKDVTPALPPGSFGDPQNPIWTTAEDADIQSQMFRDKVWVPLLKKSR